MKRIGNVTSPDVIEEMAEDQFVTLRTRITTVLLMVVNPVHKTIRFVVQEFNEQIELKVLVDTTDLYEALAYYDGQNTDYYTEAA